MLKIDLDYLTKHELQQMLTNTRTEIQNIDDVSIYSVSYYLHYCLKYVFNNPHDKRDQLLSQSTAIEMEILFREDDDKRAKYDCQRQRDPLRYGKVKRSRI